MAQIQISRVKAEGTRAMDGKAETSRFMFDLT